jgi:hypothetical protein
MARDEMGRFESVSMLIVQAKGRPMKPSQCNAHMRKALAEAFEEITKGFVEAAKKGSCQHVKLATELLRPEQKSAVRKKGTATKFLEEWERDRPLREALNAGQSGTEQAWTS